jgi:hypothetical protein|tara:strand:+ start:301 stop:537 length:237 start_codon:yes stop_codon:yes gene_type:complete
VGAKPMLLGDEKMKENENNEKNMKELIAALIDMVEAKTKEIESDTKINIQFMKDMNIDPTVEIDSENNWPKKFNDEWV